MSPFVQYAVAVCRRCGRFGKSIGGTMLDATIVDHSRGVRDGMVWIPGGTFRIGSDRHYPEETPVHRVTVDGFWMDRTPVTNREFRTFVEATDYITFAEIAPDAKD